MSHTPRTDAALTGCGHVYISPEDPHVTARFARGLEEECNEYRTALEQIRDKPGWQDPEVGFMAGHIAAGALNLFRNDPAMATNPAPETPE